MIYTLTLNPAIDKTVFIDDFKVDQVNRVKEIRKDIGGKGINVSQNLTYLDKENKCISLLGGANGQWIENGLISESIDYIKIPIQGDVRVNTKVVDLNNKTFTDLNEPGFTLTSNVVEEVIQEILSYIKDDDILVLSGSVPKGFSQATYKRLIESLSCKTILDASGELFQNGIQGKPYLVKPNIHELEVYADKKLTSKDEILEVAQEIIRQGVEIVVVSLGDKGAMLVTKDQSISMKGKVVDVVNTVGAGDAMVAGLAFGLDEGYTLKKMLKFGSALATATLLTEGSQPGSLKMINRFMNMEE